MRRWARASRAWPKALALVPFALVVGTGDGICQGGEGGQEHGVLEAPESTEDEVRIVSGFG